MVCNRCVLVVQQLCEKIGLKPTGVLLGVVELPMPPSEEQTAALSSNLRELGFEVLDDRTHILIEQIKSLLIAQVQSGTIAEHFSLSEFLSKGLHREYGQVSRLFSEVEGITLEQFFILQKVEKVKEWLVYDELTLSEIAWKLGYSSVAHLSGQFKKVTGLTPSAFKKLGIEHRKPLDKVRGHK